MENDIDSYYLNLADEALHTNARDFQRIFNELNLSPGQVVTDIGGGEGRGKILFDTLYPNNKFYSIEIVKDRHEQALSRAREMGTETDGFLNEDLKKYQLPKSDYFFFYFPFTPWLHKVFKQVIAMKADVIIIESHGDFLAKFRRCYSCFYKESKKVKLEGTRHDPFAYLFRYEQSPKTLEQNLIHEVFKNPASVLEITQSDLLEGEITWLHRARDFELGLGQDEFQCSRTNRCYRFSEIKGPKVPSQAEKEILSYLNYKDIRTNSVEVRRVITHPFPMIELSNGKRFEVKKKWLNEEFASNI